MASLRLLVLMRSAVLHAVCRHVVFGVHNLIHTHAANVHSADDWRVLLTLLEVCGAGALPPQHYKNQVAATLSPEEFAEPPTGVSPQQSTAPAVTSVEQCSSGLGTQSDTECVLGSDTEGTSEVTSRGYTSDSELYTASSTGSGGGLSSSGKLLRLDPNTTNWVLMEGRDVNTTADTASASNEPHGVVKQQQQQQQQYSISYPDLSAASAYIQPAVNQYSIALNEDLKQHDSRSLMKAAETLNFIIRDAAHVTLYNFEACVHAVRVFAEASLNGGRARRSAPNGSAATVGGRGGAQQIAGATSGAGSGKGNSSSSAATKGRSGSTRRDGGGTGMHRSRTLPAMRDITDSEDESSCGPHGSVGGAGLAISSLGDAYHAVSVQVSRQ